MRQRCGKLLGNVAAKWIDRHGPDRINTGADANTEILGLVNKRNYDHDDRVNIVREWADEFVHKRHQPDIAMVEAEVRASIELQSSEAGALHLHLLERLVDHWPAALQPVVALAPYIGEWVLALNDDDDDTALVNRRIALARLSVAIHGQGTDMSAQLSRAADWTNSLPRALLTSIRNIRRPRT